MCIVKRFIVRYINRQLAANAENVEKMKGVVELWAARIKRVLFCLDCLMAKLADNEITADEIKEASGEIQELVREWK